MIYYVYLFFYFFFVSKCILTNDDIIYFSSEKNTYNMTHVWFVLLVWTALSKSENNYCHYVLDFGLPTFFRNLFLSLKILYIF